MARNATKILGLVWKNNEKISNKKTVLKSKDAFTAPGISACQINHNKQILVTKYWQKYKEFIILASLAINFILNR